MRKRRGRSRGDSTQTCRPQTQTTRRRGRWGCCSNPHPQVAETHHPRSFLWLRDCVNDTGTLPGTYTFMHIHMRVCACTMHTCAPPLHKRNTNVQCFKWRNVAKETAARRKEFPHWWRMQQAKCFSSCPFSHDEDVSLPANDWDHSPKTTCWPYVIW